MMRDSTVNKYFNFGTIQKAGLYEFKKKNEALDNYVFNFMMKLLAMFEYEGLPEGVDQEDVEKFLLFNGYCIVPTDRDIALIGGWGGELNDYYRPKTVIVNNPYANINKEYEIGKDCILIRNDPFCLGVMQLITKYATQLVEADLSINIATVFKRLTGIMSTTSDTTLESAQKFIDKIYDGEYKVIMDESLIDTLKAQELSGSGGNNILSQLIETRQYILGSLYNELGMKSVTNMKKENVSELESDQNTDILLPFILIMLNTRRKSWDEYNKKTGHNVKVKLSNIWKMREAEVEKTIDELENGEAEEGEENVIEGEVSEVVDE